MLPTGVNHVMTTFVSVAGFFRSDDDGATWIPANEGTNSMAEFVAAEMPGGNVDHPGVHRCVHKVALDPTNPERLFMQQHDGVYRSDDGGRSWQNIGGGLPSPFGFPVAAAPGSGPAGCSVWVIPENGETIRTDDGLRVWRTEEAAKPGRRRSTVCPRGSTTSSAIRNLRFQRTRDDPPRFRAHRGR